MHKIKLSFKKILFIFLIVFGLFLSLKPLPSFAVDTENFYFDDFEADYYLSKDAEGGSHLKVVETFTAVFPSFNQNKGFCRYIPYTNQKGKNVTLPKLTKEDIVLTRNGKPEPIYSIGREAGIKSYEVCTGDDSYVTGRQVYTFTYNFEKVITDFSEYQELYWDTNGNGWFQKFNVVTARVHFADDSVKKAYSGESWCYVGEYGKSGKERCTISEIEDGVKFTAKNLSRYENLTFDIQFKPNSFLVLPPEKNYTLVYIMVGFAAVCLLLLIIPFRKYLKTREKARFYKSIFVRPEYQPNKDYDVAEMAEIFIGEKKDAKVAILLDMIVKGNISLIKKEEGKIKKDKWSIKVEKADGISKKGEILLKILNGGTDYKVGDVIDIKARTANSTLVSLGRQYDKEVINNLKTAGLVEGDYKKGFGSGAISNITMIILIVFIFGPIASGIMDDLVDEHGEFMLEGDVVGEAWFLPVIGVTFIIAIIIYSCLKNQTDRFLYRTKKGLEASRYMDGLELYIKMAEKDRLAFLQSVEGADTSPEGVVHLYEKLLPYAAVLGLEKTWMKELEKYYKLEEVETPSWYYHNLSTYSMLSAVNTAANTVRSSTTYASSGGGSSSGFSGGGGGGFSGGGGGGGGGHGR